MMPRIPAAQSAAVPDCNWTVEEFKERYRAYQPRKILGGWCTPSAVERSELRAAAQAVLNATPRIPLELGHIVKIACVVGIHATINRACSSPNPHAASLYDHYWAELEPIEPWFLPITVGYDYSIEECEFGQRGGSFIVRPGFVPELLEFAGATWRAKIAADVDRLNSRSDRGDA